jgi:hypothetical protein
LLSATGLVVACYTALWFWQANAAQHRVETILAGGANSKLVLTGTRSSVGGYPFWVEIQLDDATVSGLPRLPTARVAAPSVTFRFHPFSPWRWTLTARHGVTLELPTTDGTARIEAQEATAEKGADGDGLAFRAGAITATGPEGAVRLDSINLQFELPETLPGEPVGDRLDFALEIDGLGLPHRLGPLGAVIDRIGCDGQIQGAIPRKRLAEALATWRDGGGAIELHRARVTWGKLQVDAEGTLALDRDLQPEAAFSAEIRNWTSFLDALVDGGSMTPREADFAKLGLALVGGAEGGTPLKTPVTLQNGQFKVEKARIGRLPHIDWP